MSQTRSAQIERCVREARLVTCPDDLKGTVGATMDCQLTAKGQTYPVKVTVTSIDGDQAKFDILETMDKAQVASTISDQIAQQTQQKPDSVSCPDNLKVIQGATLTCDMAQGGQTFSVTVDVSAVAAGVPAVEIQSSNQSSGAVPSSDVVRRRRAS